MKTTGSGFTVQLCFALRSEAGLRRAGGSRLELASLAFLLTGTLAMAAAGAEPPPVAPAAANPFKVGEEAVLLADGPGKGQQDTPHVAFGKNQFLVVWREGSMVEGGRARILASRVSTDGKVLDPKSIEVAPNKNVECFQAYPRVAFCPSTGSGPAGGVFLVVWQDFRNGKDYDILSAPVHKFV